MPLIIGAKSATATGYAVDNSCRFNDGDGAYLYRTSTGSDNTGTLSMWVKRSTLGTTQYLMHVQNATDNTDYGVLNFTTDDTIELMLATNGSGSMQLITDREFKDPSAWYHFLFVIDTDNATANYRMRIYVNGVEETSFSTDNRTNTGITNWFFNPSDTNKFCLAGNIAGASTFDGYISQIACCIGTAYTPSDFGEFDEDSPTIWKPKDFSGDVTFGSEGFYLDFADSGDLGDDESGNTKDFTEGSLDATDQATDTPTNNFCTLNPLDNNLVIGTLSQGNCKFTGSGYPTVYSTQAVTTGNWYMEVKVPTAAGFMIGVSGGYPNDTAFGVGLYDWAFHADGDIWNNNANSSYGSAPSDDDILGFALDVDNSAMYVAINNTWQDSGDPTSGASKTGAVAITAVGSTTLGVYHFVVGDYSGSTPIMEADFGGCPAFTVSSAASDANGYGNFEYAPPSGYLALCTKNLGSDGG